MNYTSRARKLNRLSAQLYQRSLTIEASLVVNLENEIYKEAGITDDIIKFVSDPQVMEYVSFGVKLAALIATLFPATAPAGPAILKASSAIDYVAAAGHLKNGDIIKAVFSVMSAVLSAPPAVLEKFYIFMLSDRFVSFLMRFKSLGLNYDTAAMKLFDFAKGTIPIIVDGILNIIQGIISSLRYFAPIIAKTAGITAEQVITQMTVVLNGMTSEINSKLGAAV